MINSSLNSQMRVCKDCGVWKLASDDVYCSYCGEKVASLNASLSDNIVYFGHFGAQDEIILILENDGQTDLTVEAISIEREWVEALYDNSIVYPIGTRSVSTPYQIPSGSKWEIPLKINLIKPSSYYNCNIQVNSVAGLNQVTIEVLPKPELYIHLNYPLSVLPSSLGSPSDGGTRNDDASKLAVTSVEIGKIDTSVNMPVCQLIRSSDSGKESWSCSLEIYESVVTVESIEIGLKKDEFRLSPNISISETSHTPLVLDPAGIRKLNFTMDVNVSAFPIGEYPCIIRVRCLRIREPIIGEFIISRSSRPEIEFLRATGNAIILPGEMFVRREDDTKDISIGLVNTGGLDVEISNVGVESDWLEPLFELPKPLKSGQVENLNFRTNIGKFLPQLSESGNLQLTGRLLFSFKCIEHSDYKIPDRKIELIATVAMMPLYDGIVAIDFGTANSCCAVESRAIAQQSHIVPMDETDGDKEKSGILPSVVYYKNEKDSVFEYVVGQQALAFSMMPDTSSSTVRSIKRRLGQQERVGVMLDVSKRHVEFLPEQIAGHVVKYMIDATERHIQRRITRCVVTHPARFFRPQMAALERAFEDDGGVKVVAFINEAVASALDAILEKGRSDKLEYTVIVYDFGGGTTDIALLRVKDTISEDGIREIVPETLGVDGKRRLGGDDVTDKIAEIIRMKCEKELRLSGYGHLIWKPGEDEPNAIQVPEGVDILEIKNAASINLVNIINAAEEHKKRLANGEEARLPLLSLNYVTNDNKIDSFTFSIEVTEKEMDYLIEDDIKSAMELAWGLVHSANERDNLVIKYPDIFVLSGMSSRLPIVKKLAEETFPDSNVWLHPDPKACVARGAYLIHAMSEWPAMVSVDTTLLKSPPPTSAQYGIMVYGLHGEPVFKSAIPKGARLPSEGVIGGFKIGRKTAITVYENPGKGISDPEIRKIAVCRLNIPDSVTDRELRTAQVSMRLEDEMSLKIVLRVGEKSYEFKADVEPYL